AAGAGNLISGNSGFFWLGVLVNGGTGNSILGNSIFANGGLGINLGDHDGVTENDLVPGDPDTGANNLQNFPVLTSAVTVGTTTTITGTFNSTPNHNFRIEFFTNT